ncbi:hypothetical protein CspHIS471_0200610 [Cutaneotrichosporon sp. HIS471]|nr:hypothetical protein CspHIS471_0200610 [Cutaneotrichosporon sp. HIS471]
MASIFARKAALRKEMLRTLRQIPEEALASQSAAVARVLAGQEWYTSAKTVGCYLSMARGELRTHDIVADLLDKGKVVYTPYLPPSAATGEDNLMHMHRLYSPEDHAGCPTDKWGILDPGTKRYDVEGDREDAMDPAAPGLDVILVPGVAFDANCNRLGRGKAFYDRFLATYTAQKKRPLLMALALEPQLVDDVPVTPNDFGLDGVVSPGGVVWREGKSRA